MESILHTPPLVIGHRGASSEAPENTPASFRLAFAQGADGIETDFRLSADGVLVCLHDPSTRRTAGVELEVAAATAAELARLDVGSWKGEAWRGERILTLEELLQALPEDKYLLAELKGGPELVPALERALAASPVAPERVRILSFSWELILKVKESLPGYRALWLTDYRWRGGWRPGREEVLDTLRRCRADGLASRARGVVDREFVAALRSEGWELHLWTVDQAREAKRLAELGVDAIMTNRPGWLVRALYRWRSGGSSVPPREVAP